MKKITLLCCICFFFINQIWAGSPWKTGAYDYNGTFADFSEKYELKEATRRMMLRISKYEEDGMSAKDRSNLKEELNQKNKSGYAPIFDAIDYNYVELVQKMLQYGADPNTRTTNNWTPLFYGLKKNTNPEIIKSLLDYGANPNVFDENKESPLLYALKYNMSLEIIKKMLDKGADANYTWNKGDFTNYTPIYVAVKSQNTDFINLVLEKTNAETLSKKAKWKNLEETPFACLCRNISKSTAPERKLLDIIDKFIEKEADIDSEIVQEKNAYTPLLFLLVNNYNANKRDFVEKLIENGANVDKEFILENGKISTLQLAYETKDFDIFKKILEKSTKETIDKIEAIKRENITYKNSLLSMLLWNYDVKDEFLKYAINALLEKNADTNIPYAIGENQFTPLYIAVWRLSDSRIREDEKYELTKKLLKKGADPNKTNKITKEDSSVDEFTTFHYVAYKNMEKFYKLFEEYDGNKLAKDSYGNTVLYYKGSHIKNIADRIDFSYEEDKQYKPDFNENIDYNIVTTKLKMNLLQICIRHGDSTSAKFLLENNKISWDKEDDNGENALDYALNYNNYDVVQYLIDKKVDIGKSIFSVIEKTFENGNTDPLSKFLQNGSFTNIKKTYGDNNVKLDPITYAAVYHLDVVTTDIAVNRSNVLSVLLENKGNLGKFGLNEKITKDGKTAILMAEDEDTVLKLIYYGAAMNIPDNSGKNAIDYAFEKNQTFVIDKLLESKTKIGASIFSAIDSELSGHDAKLMQFMELEEASGLSKLTKEEQYGNNKVRMPLAIYVICKKTEEMRNTSARIEILEKIIGSGADINATVRGGEYSGDTALIFAVKNRDEKLVEFLLEKNADISIQSKGTENSGRNAIFYALENKNEAILKNILRKVGENITNVTTTNQKDNGASLLMFLARYGSKDVILEFLPKILKKDKYCLEKTDRDGKTAFLYAASYNNDYAAIKYFRMYGANVYATDSNGKNAADLAKAENNNEEVLRRLESYGVYGK